MMKIRGGRRGTGSALLSLGIGVVGAAIGFAAGYALLSRSDNGQLRAAQAQAKKLIEDATAEASAKKKAALLAARDEILRTKAEFEQELKERRAELARQERRIAAKEETLDRKLEALEKKDELLTKKLRENTELSETLERERTRQTEELERERTRQTEDLERERTLQAEDLARKKADAEDKLARKISDAEAEIARKTAETDEALAKQREEAEAEVARMKAEELETLQSLAGLTAEEAKARLVQELDEEIRHEQAERLSELEETFKDEAETKARNIIALAIQRIASDQVAESTVSVVPLPNDEMKGRIIGREGRNIRTIEQLAGVDLIIDDTPEAITISGFDPVRREVARIALEKLVSDGRIHPARIEESVAKAQQQVENEIKAAGDRATFDTGLRGFSPELIKLLGRLKYRTSYGQNVLMHSVEVALLSGIIADELGVDSTLAKRAGLLHDIGKAMTQEVEGSHVQLGVDLAKRFHESPDVIHAIEAHHGDVEPKTLVAMIVQAADAISAARPGARRENLENYIKRLTKLEEIANSFEGVEKSYAIQAGRELRIMVKPEKIGDDDMALVAHEIARKIEGELEYPGQIKVSIIRENRATDYAK